MSLITRQRDTKLKDQKSNVTNVNCSNLTKMEMIGVCLPLSFSGKSGYRKSIFRSMSHIFIYISTYVFSCVGLPQTWGSKALFVSSLVLMYMTNALINIASKSIALPNSKVNSNSFLCRIIGD